MWTVFEDDNSIGSPLRLITKEELIENFKKLEAEGWIYNYRGGNDGAVGNIVEDKFNIPENNLPIPNAAEWELKAQRASTTSLLTLKHTEPSPRAACLIPRMLLPKYGWPHQQAGRKYPASEMSFRSTTYAHYFTDRGFRLFVNRKEQRIEFIWDSTKVDPRHKEWLDSVEKRIGLGPMPVTPYWGFNDLYTAVGSKLTNAFYVRAETKREAKKEYFHYNDVRILKHVDFNKFIDCIEKGYVAIDFDARTGHNHGTKFRVDFHHLPEFYSEVIPIITPK